MAMTPKQLAASRARGVKTRIHNKAVATATTQREKYEANNPERFQTITDMPGSTGSVAHDYRAMNIGVQHEPGTQLQGQMALPGMEHHPATVAHPPRWEELSDNQRRNTLSRAAEYGVTPEYLHRSLGAQVDQAAIRESKMGTGKHRSFYGAEGTDDHGDMLPRTRLKTSAAENGVPFHVQAVANSITSPKQKFVERPKSGPRAGQTVYRNDEVATSAIQQERSGKPIADVRTPQGMPGFHGNTRKAADVVRQMNSGVPAREAWKPGPKTGPYHNSWVDPHGPSQYWTSDIHSGAALAAHLPQDVREQEYMNIPNIHALHDHVASNVQRERRIPSLSGMQSMQWSEERRQRGLETDHLRAQKPLNRSQFPGQGSLFD